MRAAATLKLLWRWSNQVHLLVLPVYSGGELQPQPEIASLCQTWRLVSNPNPNLYDAPLPEWVDALGDGQVWPGEWRNYNDAWQKKVTAAIEQVNADLILVFRFYLMHLLGPAAAETPLWLDVDELESNARERLACAYELAGNHNEAEVWHREAQAYAKLEERFLPSFSRVFAASALEAENIGHLYPAVRALALPNTYPFVCPQPEPKANAKVRLLYVGSFGYFPNGDAISYFSQEILPIIKEHSPVPVEVIVIGSAMPVVGQHPSLPGLTLIGSVPETTPYYADCDIVIVPLRAGGGTRIKILEAFSHQRPVVSTAIGAEGLDVQTDVHIKIADGTEEFASSCLQLINDAGERCQIARRGHEYFKEHHTLPGLEETASALFGEAEWSDQHQ